MLAQVLRGMPYLDSSTKQSLIEKPLVISKLLEGFLPTVALLIDTIVHIDRSIKPTYPNWMKKILHPELESTGPVDYDIASAVSLWLHDKQKYGSVTTGNVIYDALKQSGIELCGNFQDALAIKKLGAATFRKVFGSNIVYFWKSIVQDRHGYLHVPYLHMDGGRVVLAWYWLDRDWRGHQSAVRFAK